MYIEYLGENIIMLPRNLSRRYNQKQVVYLQTPKYTFQILKLN